MSLALPTNTADPPPAASDAEGWTCPFCALLCESWHPVAGEPRGLRGNDCPRALAGVAALAPAAPGAPAALVDGQPADLATALDAAADRLSGWQQPLFGGLGTDIAGARVLYRLAARCGAVCDHADGELLSQATRAVQDRGQFTTTLAELRSRASLIVFVGTTGVARYPELFRRIGLGDAESPCRRVVFLGTALPAPLPAAVPTDALPGSGDLAADLQQLAALVDHQRLRGADPALAALAEQLRASPYSVLVWEGATLPPEAALAIEMINRIVATLNRSTRSASFGLGGNDGAQSVQQTFTWLSGLPLRTRIAASGLAHEPRSHGSTALLRGGAVDGLLWISSFDPTRLPPPTPLPKIVLGPPAMRPAWTAATSLDHTVWIAVATPGVHVGGHLFRVDGPVVMPLRGWRDEGLPGVARVLTGLVERLEAGR